MLQLLLARLHTITYYTYYYYYCIAYYETDKIRFSIIILLKFKSNFKSFDCLKKNSMTYSNRRNLVGI